MVDLNTPSLMPIYLLKVKPKKELTELVDIGSFGTNMGLKRMSDLSTKKNLAHRVVMDFL